MAGAGVPKHRALWVILRAAQVETWHKQVARRAKGTQTHAPCEIEPCTAAALGQPPGSSAPSLPPAPCVRQPALPAAPLSPLRHRTLQIKSFGPCLTDSANYTWGPVLRVTEVGMGKIGPTWSILALTSAQARKGGVCTEGQTQQWRIPEGRHSGGAGLTLPEQIEAPASGQPPALQSQQRLLPAEVAYES